MHSLARFRHRTGLGNNITPIKGELGKNTTPINRGPSEPERGCELGASGTSVGGSDTCPCTQTWVEGDDEDIPNLVFGVEIRANT